MPAGKQKSILLQEKQTRDPITIRPLILLHLCTNAHTQRKDRQLDWKQISIIYHPFPKLPLLSCVHTFKFYEIIKSIFRMQLGARSVFINVPYLPESKKRKEKVNSDIATVTSYIVQYRICSTSMHIHLS